MRSRARCRSDGEPHGVHGLAGVLGQVGEHAAVLGREPVFPRTQSKDELPQRGTVVRERERDRRAGALPVRGDALEPAVLLHLDRDVREAQRLRDRLDDAGQHGLGGRRHLEATSQAGNRRRRIVALAVEQVVDGALQPVAQRVEHERHQPRGDDRGADSHLLAQERPRERDHDCVGAHDAGRQCAVEQCAIDDDVDLVQPVAQDRDARDDRQGDEAEDARRPEEVGERGRERSDGQGSDEEERHHSRGADEPLELQSLVAARAPEAHDQCGERQRQDERASDIEDVVDPDRQDAERIADDPRLGAELGVHQHAPDRGPGQDDGREPEHRSPSPSQWTPGREELRQEQHDREQDRLAEPVRQPRGHLVAGQRTLVVRKW